jgi:hypothetical protein
LRQRTLAFNSRGNIRHKCMSVKQEVFNYGVLHMRTLTFSFRPHTLHHFLWCDHNKTTEGRAMALAGSRRRLTADVRVRSQAK